MTALTDDFENYTVQKKKSALKRFSKEMLSNNIHANTLLAMGVFIQNLGSLRDNVRKDFSSKFATFKHEENQSAFKALLAAKDSYNNLPNNLDSSFSMKHCQAHS